MTALPNDCFLSIQDKDGPDGHVYKSKGAVMIALAELQPELAHMAQSFPIRLPTHDVAYFKRWIRENALPPFAEAWTLFENFWEHFASSCVSSLQISFSSIELHINTGSHPSHVPALWTKYSRHSINPPPQNLSISPWDTD